MADSYAAALAAANELYKDGKNSEAAAKYTEAVKAAPEKYRHSTLLSRARAYFRLGKYTRALGDCSEVLGSQEATLKCAANQLKGECFLHEEELEGALEAFEAAKSFAKTASATAAVDAFTAATEKALKDRSAVDFEALRSHSAAASAKDRGYVPAPPATNALADAIRSQAEGGGEDVDMVAADENAAANDSKAVDLQAQQARNNSAMARPGPAVRAEDLSVAEAPFAGHVPLVAPSKYRLQYNQNAGIVEVQVFAKKLNTQKERVTVEIASNHLKVLIRDEANENVEYTFDDDLYQAIDADASTFNILGTQILIKLKKLDGGISWPSLGKSDVPAVTGGASIVDASAAPAREYPSSHTAAKKVHRDWDKLESEVKQEEKDEKLDGEAGLQKFFQGLYGNLDEDARRAMNKSFQESGGTTLSTNWKDIGSKTLTCEPPEGVAVKKFEQ